MLECSERNENTVPSMLIEESGGFIWLNFESEGCSGYVRFTPGDDPEAFISDYTMNVEKVLKPALAFAATLQKLREYE